MNKRSDKPLRETKPTFEAEPPKVKRAKLIAIGNSTGVILPKDVLARLRLAKGDEVSIGETPDGLTLRVFDPDFEAQMGAAESIMHEDRDILRELAK